MVTKIVRIAEALGLVSTDSPERLTDDFVGAVMVEVGAGPADRHGESWAALAEHRDKLKGWRDGRVLGEEDGPTVGPAGSGRPGADA